MSPNVVFSPGTALRLLHRHEHDTIGVNFIAFAFFSFYSDAWCPRSLRTGIDCYVARISPLMHPMGLRLPQNTQKRLYCCLCTVAVPVPRQPLFSSKIASSASRSMDVA